MAERSRPRKLGIYLRTVRSIGSVNKINIWVAGATVEGANQLIMERNNTRKKKNSIFFPTKSIQDIASVKPMLIWPNCNQSAKKNFIIATN